MGSRDISGSVGMKARRIAETGKEGKKDEVRIMKEKAAQPQRSDQ
jgi:hypothetical protein